MLDNLLNSVNNVIIAIKQFGRLKQLIIQREIDRLKNSQRYQNPNNLVRYGTKIYSQTDEDGIIREIFRRIGITTKSFIEIGIGNGLENNTFALLFEDWRGLWVDASYSSIRAINKHLAPIIQSKRLNVVHAFVTRQNVNRIIASHNITSEIDLLSIDIDGNDYHILSSIQCVRPRVIVMEYNAKFPPPILFCMEYDENHSWKHDDCFGASLKFLEIKLGELGYCLVGCNLTGTNAFFVRSDLVYDFFQEPFVAEIHYEPARYYLLGTASGHPPTYKTLTRSSTLHSVQTTEIS